MKISKELFDDLSNLVHIGRIDSKGKELLNPNPLVSVHPLERPPTLREQIQRVLRGELSRQASMQGMESFEESQDFDIEDDSFSIPEGNTPYELAGLDAPVMIDEEPAGPPPEPKPADPPAPESKTAEPPEQE